MWREELQKVAQEKSQYGEQINIGGTNGEILLLKENARKVLGKDLPEEYLDFLRTINGIEFNGFIIYGIDPELLESIPNQRVNGLINHNMVLYENEWQAKYLFIGESSISWYVYDLEDMRFKQLDNPSGRIVGEYSCFDAMAESILRDSLK